MKTLLVTLILIASVLSISATQQTKPQSWEYKFEYKINEKKANALGAEGWELAAIESTSSSGIISNVPTYVFKRAR